MGRVTLLVLGVCGGVLFAACGGATDTPLLGDSGQQQTDATAQDTGSGNDGGTQKDVTVEDAPVIVDVVTVDVPVGPPDSKIKCGQTTCSAQTQVCCATVSNTIQFACVASVSDCANSDQVPIACASQENCASQGNAGFVCCGLPNGPQNPISQCSQFTTASGTQCQASCDTQNGEFEVGCSVQTQNCTDTQQTCINSQCTLPGYTLCH